jgi:hypothetical protein
VGKGLISANLAAQDDGFFVGESLEETDLEFGTRVMGYA